MLPQRSHIALKRGIYYYRRRIPGTALDVAVSLRTGNYREAQFLAKVADVSFRNCLQKTPVTADIQGILREHLVQALALDRELHLAAPYGRPVYTLGVPGDVHVNPVDADLEAIDYQLSDAREALATRDVRQVEHLVKEYMVSHGVEPSQRRELGLGLLKVIVQALEVSKQRVVEGVIDDVPLQAPLAPVVPQEALVAPESAGPPLSEVLPAFIAYLTTEGGLRAQTINQNKATYRYLIETCGDLPVGAYKRADLAKLLNLLRALPASYSKDTRWKGLTLSEIAERATRDEPRLAVKTQKRHFAALGTLFKYLIEQGEYEGANPAHGFSFPNKGRANSKRQQWGGERLQQLFASPVWTGSKTARQRSKPGELIEKDEKYWLPLLGLYHGNRLEEFAQLLRSDVRVEDGIWYLDINDEGDKQLKNEQSYRRVPIHPALHQLGFLQYVETIAPMPADPVFPQLAPGGADGKRGHAFTKWWTRYRKDIGLYEPGLDYHSFRHGVTTKLFAAEVPEVFVDELTGHEGKGTSRAVYTKRMPLVKLYEAICKVEWPEVELLALGCTAKISEAPSDQ